MPLRTTRRAVSWLAAALLLCMPQPSTAFAGNPRPGKVFVYSGATGALIRTVDSPEPQHKSMFGFSLAGVGDVNADGVPDIAVGAPRFDPPGIRNTGKAYVISGADGSLLLALAAPPQRKKVLFGWSVAAAGDMNGDGVADLAVGAPRAPGSGRSRPGEAWLFSGATGAPLASLAPPLRRGGSRLGQSLAAGGDPDGDGIPEIAVGAPRENVAGRKSQGRVHLFDPNGAHEAVVENPAPQAEARFGQGLTFIPDADGDGVEDLAVGAHGQHVRDGDHAGRVFVLRATDPNNPLIGSRAALVPGRGANFGFALAGVEDVSSDGLGDLVATAPDQDTVRELGGAAYSVSGEPDDPTTSDDTIYVLSELADPDPGRIAFFGGSVAALPDITGDGLPEAVVGSELHKDATGIRSGRAYVYQAATGALVFTVPSPSGDTCSRFGWAVASLGDVDGDAVGDFAVGAPLHRETPLLQRRRCF